MHPVESVEHRQRGLEGITIIEGAHVGITVGLRVDGSSEVILYADIGIDGREESPYRLFLRCQLTVELQLGTLHLMVMRNSILHTLPHGPFLLGNRLTGE